MTYSVGRARTSKLAGLIAGMVAVTVSVTGCGGEREDTDSRSPRTSTETVADLTKEAAAFGRIVIPDGVTVLAARTDSALDTRYQLALSADPQGLSNFLTASDFSTPLTKTYTVTEKTIAGPPLETSPSLLETGDRIQRPGGKYVSRSVTVDERDATTRYIHVQLYTT
ncbi:hypothetical protein [Nocardia blacklockiae]|uniref:hypothetical protein n=1 Tax=Nocardia blacklockiae TaxID=480036 RepID=UPI00189559DD|nr:hypothetical protein [Nocardia blacklockiae]MBF6175299.1 hypothetical protein [Nocardia blacklockiae]